MNTAAPNNMLHVKLKGCKYIGYVQTAVSYIEKSTSIFNDISNLSDWQTDRQTDRETDRKTDRQTYMQKNRRTD